MIAQSKLPPNAAISVATPSTCISMIRRVAIRLRGRTRTPAMGETIFMTTVPQLRSSRVTEPGPPCRSLPRRNNKWHDQCHNAPYWGSAQAAIGARHELTVEASDSPALDAWLDA